MFLTRTLLTVTCLNIGLSLASWNKIPYSVDYSKKPYKRIPIATPTPTAAAAVAAAAPVGPEALNLNSSPSASTFLSRAGFIGGDDEPIYVVKRPRFRSSYKIRESGYGNVDYGRWSLGSLGGFGSGGGGDIDGHGGVGSGVFMLGGGNRRRHTEPEHLSVHYQDQGYGHGGWQPPSPPKKKTHSSQYLTTPTHEKPGFVQKLIPIPMFPIKGKFSEIITWFSDPHGHRHGFNRHHEKQDHGHGHGWHR